MTSEPMKPETALAVVLIAFLIGLVVYEAVVWLKKIRNRYVPVSFQKDGPWLKVFRDRQ